jgi:enoyl-CoA hydratase
LASEVRLEREGAIATVTVDSPPVNALHPNVAAMLLARIEELAAEPDVRCVILTGAGRHFMAGADIAHFPNLDRASGEAYALSIQQMQFALGGLAPPVIAAVHGAVLGGGCELALACDLRIAEETASFGLPEVSLGLIPGAGGTQNLARLIPVGHAKRMLFTAERLPAAEALAWGLVDEVVPRGEAVSRARQLADQICRNAPLAVAAAKRAVNQGLQMTVEDGHRLEAAEFAALVETSDFREGVDAFFAKREPRFTGH